MRKALQAEQSKAEMLIKIQNIEDECADLEEAVEEERRRIARNLKDERAERDRAKENHGDDIDLITDGNQRISSDLKTLLLTFQEIASHDDDN